MNYFCPYSNVDFFVFRLDEFFAFRLDESHDEWMECSSKKNRINKVEIIKVVSILVYLSVNNFRSVDVILRSLGTDPTRA